MKKTTLLSIAAALLLGASSIHAQSSEEQIRATMSKKLPNTPIDEVLPSSFEGLYEVWTGRNVMFVDAKCEKTIIGHQFDFNGNDETQVKINTRMMEQLKKEIDLTKALKIGNGKHEVILFTDPQCPFCRRAEELMVNGDVTKYVFFYTPLPQHTKTRPMSVDILCSKDAQSRYDNAMSGKLDNAKPKELMSCQDGERRYDEMKAIAEKVGIQGTPMLIIDGRPVEGAQPIIPSLVTSSQEENK